MSTNRRATLTAPAKPGHCRWCAAPVKPPRRTWCSQACVLDYQIRNSPAMARHKVFERDRGVCSLCGLDCDRLEKRVEAERRRVQAYRRRVGLGPIPYDYDEPDGIPRDYAVLIDGRRWRVPDRSLWEADHIVPVAEGGGECGLENLRTLCLWCHRTVTAELRRRLARRRAGATA